MVKNRFFILFFLVFMSCGSVSYASDISTPSDASHTDAEKTDLIFDTDCDNALYLSSSVDGASLNDIYSMLLSLRNCMLAIGFILIMFKCHSVLQIAFKKHLKS